LGIVEVALQFINGPIQLIENIGRVPAAEIAIFALRCLGTNLPQAFQPVPNGTVIHIEQVFYLALAIGLGDARRIGIVEAGFLRHETARMVVILHHGRSPLCSCTRKERAEATGSSITRSFQFRSPGSSLTRRRVGVSSLPP